MDICLRGVLPKDSNSLLCWRNDPETRHNSINTHEISRERHDRWFEELLKHHPERVAIAEMNGSPVGVIRLDWSEQNDSCDLSFTVAPEHRGKGVGFRMVQLSIQDLRNARILAEVKLSNVASRRIFERLGFTIIDNQGDLLLYAKDV